MQLPPCERASSGGPGEGRAAARRAPPWLRAAFARGLGREAKHKQRSVAPPLPVPVRAASDAPACPVVSSEAAVPKLPLPLPKGSNLCK